MSPPQVLSFTTLPETNRWSKKPVTSAFFIKRIVEGQIIKFRGKHLGHVEVGAEEEGEVAEGRGGLLEPQEGRAFDRC